MATEWTVNIPKHITLDADPETKTAQSGYEVSVLGSIQPSHNIVVRPDTSFTMSCDDEKATAAVTQDAVTFSGSDLTLDVPVIAAGNVSVGGLKGGTYEGNFNFYISEETEPEEHVHSYTETVTKQPTCTEAGEKTYTCSCGDSYTETVAMVSHNYVNGKCLECEQADPNFDNYALAPENAIENWNYTLDDANDIVTLNYYSGSETEVIVYANYPINGKNYKTQISSHSSPLYMFSNSVYCSNITSITFSKAIDTSNVTNMENMFSGCTALTSLDLSCFDTSSVTNMSGMFTKCDALTSLDLSGFDTSNVTDMSNMFGSILGGCKRLTSLDLSSFDTSNVTDMSDMFYGCWDLTSLDLSNFDTSNVTDMSNMFASCWDLASLDLSSFDTNNVTNMYDMFYNCESLTVLDLSNFDTNNVTDMRKMFQNCKALMAIYVTNGKWDISKADTTDMFKSCKTSTVTYK